MDPIEKMLIQKGFTWDGKSWVPSVKTSANTIITSELKKLCSAAVKRGRSGKNELPIRDSMEDLINSDGVVVACTIILEGLFSGLNGSKGLMRHWSESYAKKKKVIERVKAISDGRKFDGQVKIIYTRYSQMLMDWDNLGSTAKFPFDALVAAEIIKDDNPAIVVECLFKQEKCRRKDQRVEIYIEQIN